MALSKKSNLSIAIQKADANQESQPQTHVNFKHEKPLVRANSITSGEGLALGFLPMIGLASTATSSPLIRSYRPDLAAITTSFDDHSEPHLASLKDRLAELYSYVPHGSVFERQSTLDSGENTLQEHVDIRQKDTGNTSLKEAEPTGALVDESRDRQLEEGFIFGQESAADMSQLDVHVDDRIDIDLDIDIDHHVNQEIDENREVAEEEDEEGEEEEDDDDDKDEDYSTVNPENEEDLKDYVLGGYHTCHIGETYRNNKYILMRKLGWGHFSTVWLARDNDKQCHVAMKIVRSAKHYTDTAIDEIKLLDKVTTTELRHPGHQHVIQLLDTFTHCGPNGTHVCMVFEVLGENLLGLIRRYKHRGIPVVFVKQIAKQLLSCLDFLHRMCGVIHTDLKPENVLIEIGDVEQIVRMVEEEEQQEKLQRKMLRTKSRVSTSVPQSAGSDTPASPQLQRVKSISETSKSPNLGRSGRDLRRQTLITGSQPLPSPLRSFSKTFPNTQGVSATTSNTPVHPALGQLSFAANATNSAGNNAATSLKLTGVHKPALGHGSFNNSENEYSEPNDKSLNNSISPMSISHNGSNNPETRFGHVDASSAAYNDPMVINEDELISVKVADLGNACWVHHHFTDEIQTRQYRSPEVLLGYHWGASADLWSFACLIFELLTGDYLFDPRNGKSYNKDDDHIAQVVELMGNFPQSMLNESYNAREFFDSKGDLCRISKLKPWCLKDVLIEKYKFPLNDAVEIAAFLLPMLTLQPETRADAGGMINHPWLSDALGLENVVLERPVGGSGEDIPGWLRESSRHQPDSRPNHRQYFAHR